MNRIIEPVMNWDRDRWGCHDRWDRGSWRWGWKARDWELGRHHRRDGCWDRW